MVCERRVKGFGVYALKRSTEVVRVLNAKKGLVLQCRLGGRRVVTRSQHTLCSIGEQLKASWLAPRPACSKYNRLVSSRDSTLGDVLTALVEVGTCRPLKEMLGGRAHCHTTILQSGRKALPDSQLCTTHHSQRQDDADDEHDRD